MRTVDVRPRRRFSWDFEIVADGRAVSRLDLRRFHSAGSFEVDGVAYGLRRERPVFGAYVLEREGRVVARATRDGLLRPVYNIAAEDRLLTLRPAGLLGRGFRIVHGDHVVGGLTRPRFFQRRVVVTTPPEFPLVLEIFLVFVALVHWRRRRRAASASAG